MRAHPAYAGVGDEAVAVRGCCGTIARPVLLVCVVVAGGSSAEKLRQLHLMGALPVRPRLVGMAVSPVYRRAARWLVFSGDEMSFSSGLRSSSLRP